MAKYLVLATLFAAACGSKPRQAPGADSAAAAPLAPAAAAPQDTTAKVAGDTAKRP